MSSPTHVALTEPARLLLLLSILANDRKISNNSKSFIKELVLRRDERLSKLYNTFEDSSDEQFIEELHDLIADESLKVYDELFEDTSLDIGKTLSKNERDAKNLGEEKSLIYGEVEFQSFYRVLRKINPPSGKKFYDLGSGTGKAVFAARLTQDFGRCIGIEILHGLHQQARLIVDRYNSSFRQLLCLSQNQYASVYHGSFLEYDWTDGDVIFANSTCFDDNLMEAMSRKAEGCQPGTFFVTFTKGLTSKVYELLERKRYKMSWGPATVYIHRRLNTDGTPIGNFKLNILPSDEVEYDDSERSERYNSKAVPKAYVVSDDSDDDSNDNSDDEKDGYQYEDDYDVIDDDIDVDDIYVEEEEYDDSDDDESDDDDYRRGDIEVEDPSMVVDRETSYNSAENSRPSYTQKLVAPSLLSPSGDSFNSSFNSLGSPQDSALLARKRSGKSYII